MRRYLVRFLKDVVGDRGQEVEICQRWFELEAEGESQAVEDAKRRFCDAECIPEWSPRADRVQVAESEYPS